MATVKSATTAVAISSRVDTGARVTLTELRTSSPHGTRAALERGDVKSVVDGIKDRFPKTLARLAE